MLNITDMQQLHIADALLWKLVNSFSAHMLCCNPEFRSCQAELKASELTELLQLSALEHLIIFRQLEARDFGSVDTVVTADFEALYAYKRGDYQRCLQLSAQNVLTLLNATDITAVLIFPEFIQLLDDNIVSLIALTLIVNPVPECIVSLRRLCCCI